MDIFNTKLHLSDMSWYTDPDYETWISLWSKYIICGRCSGIRRIDKSCPSCSDPVPNLQPRFLSDASGRTHTVHSAFMGAEGRYEDYVYLEAMQREWNQPIKSASSDPKLGSYTSQRAIVVLLFWTYFETRIGRLCRHGLNNIPAALAEDILKRYGQVGARLQRLCKLLLGGTYFELLRQSGFDDIAEHLENVWKRRNEFAHGDPNAIDDVLVGAVVENLKREHEGWVTVYNIQASRMIKRSQLPAT